MYGNEGEKWVMVKPLSLNNMKINEVGSEFRIAPYHSVPHGYAAIEYERCLLYIPDKVFEEHFVKKSIYDQYAKLGDRLFINANGNLASYTIENITGDGHLSKSEFYDLLGIREMFSPDKDKGIL